MRNWTLVDAIVLFPFVLFFFEREVMSRLGVVVLKDDLIMTEKKEFLVSSK